MRLPIIVPTLLCLAAGSTYAVEFAGVEVHGFYSQGYVNTNENEFLADRSQHGSFDLNEAGVNLSYNANDRLRFAGQIYGSDLYGDPQMINKGSFSQTRAAKVNLDYLYVQYTFADQFGLRAGRVKQAYGFYNEVRDIDAARSTAILPQAVYDNRDRETNFLVTGVSGFGSLDLAKAGSVEYQVYWGTVKIPRNGTIARQYVADDLNLDSLYVDAVVGGQLLWNAPVEGLRFGLSYRQTQGLGAKTTIPAGTDIGGGPLPLDLPLQVDIDKTDAWLGSVEYIVGDLTLQAEYQRVKSQQTYKFSGPLAPFIPPLSPSPSDAEGYYVLGSYRVLPQVEVGGIFSMYSANYQNRKTDDWNTFQEDIGAFVRFDPCSWWTLKAEGHYVEGAGLLDKPNRDAGYFSGGPVSAEYWSYFVARSTFSF